MLVSGSEADLRGGRELVKPSKELIRMLGVRLELKRAELKQQLQVVCLFFFQAEDGIRYLTVTGVQTCALPICGSPASVESVERRCPEIVVIFWREFWPRGGLRNQAPGGFSLCGLRRRLPLEEFTRSRKYFLQRLDVRNDIADLRRVEHIFHSRHQRIAGFDPLCQRGRGNGVSVHGKRSPLGNAFQPGADFLLIARRKMADGALLLEHFLAARYRSRSGMAR